MLTLTNALLASRDGRTCEQPHRGNGRREQDRAVEQPGEDVAEPVLAEILPAVRLVEREGSHRADCPGLPLGTATELPPEQVGDQAIVVNHTVDATAGIRATRAARRARPTEPAPERDRDTSFYYDCSTYRRGWHPFASRPRHRQSDRSGASRAPARLAVADLGEPLHDSTPRLHLMIDGPAVDGLVDHRALADDCRAEQFHHLVRQGSASGGDNAKSDEVRHPVRQLSRAGNPREGSCVAPGPDAGREDREGAAKQARDGGGELRELLGTGRPSATHPAPALARSPAHGIYRGCRNCGLSRRPEANEKITMHSCLPVLQNVLP